MNINKTRLTNLKARSTIGVASLLVLCSLAGCANLHGLFKPLVSRQQLQQEQQAKLNKLHQQNLRDEYRSANVLQTDLTKPVSKRDYILPNGKQYILRGK